MFGLFKRKPSPSNGPNFSAVDSQAKAEAMWRKGDLEKLFLMPLNWGGEDIPHNTLYVPIGTAAAKSEIDTNVIGPLAADGQIRRYEAVPEYQGDSFIPIAIQIKAWDPGEVTVAINIWGEALKREKS